MLVPLRLPAPVFPADCVVVAVPTDQSLLLPTLHPTGKVAEDVVPIELKSTMMELLMDVKDC